MAEPKSELKRVQRSCRLKWVPITQMKVPTAFVSQRRFRPAWAEELARDFDPDLIGAPIVNFRDGWYWLMDGQHRIAALKLIGWGDQSVQCWTYEGLTEKEESATFLGSNNSKAIDTFTKFKVSVSAGYEVECDIDRIVRGHGLCVSRDNIPGAISAVGTLRKVYTRSNPKTLARTLKMVRDAYGDAGLEAPLIDGLSLLCHRYNGQLDDTLAIKKLSNVHGGAQGLLGRAEMIRRSTGNSKAHCVAAAAVDVINQGVRGANRLPSWWKEES